MHEVVFLLLLQWQVVKLFPNLEEFIGIVENTIARTSKIKVEEAEILTRPDETFDLLRVVLLELVEG